MFLVTDGATLTLDGLTFWDGDGDRTNSAIWIQNGTVNAKDTVFRDFRISGNGAVFTLEKDGKLIVAGDNNRTTTEGSSDRTFINASATYGGAIYCVGGTVEINAGAMFKQCSSAGNGGAIYNSGGIIKINNTTGTTFWGCKAAVHAAAIFNENSGTVEMKAGTVDYNSATGVAGAIYNNGAGCQFIMSGGSIVNNSAGSNGGAIYNDGGAVTISGGTIEGNSGVCGGAIYSSGTVNISGGTFTSNKATCASNTGQGGGVVAAVAGNLTVTGGFFSGNTAGHVGGVFLVTGGANCAISGAGFNSNYAVMGHDLFVFKGAGTVTVQNPSFNTDQQRTYVACVNNGSEYTQTETTPRTANLAFGDPATVNHFSNVGYKFLARSARNDEFSIMAGAGNYIDKNVMSNDTTSMTLAGFGTTKGGYTVNTEYVENNGTPLFQGSTEITTTYGVVTKQDDETARYTLRSDVVAAGHTNVALQDVFYYDAWTTIGSGTTGRTYAKVTVTINPNTTHAYSETIVTVAPTCSQQGTTTVKCENCDYVKSVTTTAATGNHSWDDGKVTTPATCVPGVKTFTCTVCGTTKTEVIDSTGTGHTESSTYKQVDGTNHAYSCGVCSTWVEQAHSYGAATTYTANGITVTEKACTKCGYKKVEYSGVETPTVFVGRASTTAGSTVTLPVRLVNNSGVWAQNFIIYYPENLELENVSSSTELYPDTGVVSTKDITAVDNSRVKSAMLAQEKSPAGMKALVYYVENAALEDITTSQGDIVYLTFKVPSNALSEYNIGIIGIDDDAINCDLEVISNMTYVDGKITVTNSGNCAHSNKTEYQSYNATCVIDGYTCYKCNDCKNIISSTYTKATGNHSYEVKASGNATCSQRAYETKVCKACGDTVTTYIGNYANHSMGTEDVIKQATAMTNGIKRRECTVCDYYEDSEFGVITPDTGISTGEANTYSYVLTENIVAGGEYVITNKKDNGEAVSMSADASSTSIINGVVTVSGNTVVEDTVQNNEIWTATSDGLLVNKATGQYLKAFENSKNTKMTHLNVGLASDPFTNSEQFFFNSGAYNKNNFGYYLGWANYVTESVETALPSNSYLKASSWIAFHSGIDSDLSHKVYLDTNFEIEFDATFGSETAKLRMFRPIETTDDYGTHGAYYTGNNSTDPDNYSWNKFCIEITPTTVMIAGADFATNKKEYFPNDENPTWSEIYGSEKGEYSSGTYYNLTQWNHYKITVDGTYARAYVNGKLVVTAVLPDNFAIVKTATDYNVVNSRGLVLLNYDWMPAQTAESMDEWNVGIDNMKIVTHNNTWGEDSDGNRVSTIGGSDTFTFFWDFEDEDGNGEISGMDNYQTGGKITVTDNTQNVEDGYVLGNDVVYAAQKFIASGDSSNKVYFYKKTSSNRAAEIYKRVNEIEAGAEYVIVSDNLEGNNKIVKRDGNTADITVYSDAVSFDPYVTLADGGQYSFVLVGSDDAGYLINSADKDTKAYLKANGGVTTSPTSDNIIKIQTNLNGNKYFEINGTRYYLYKKTEVTKIDTDIVNDISVVDFGWGFVLDGETLRNNDSWVSSWNEKKDATAMKLSSLVGSIPNGVQKNNYFYKTSKVTGSDSINIDGATATLNGTAINYSPNGKYEDEKSFGYEFLVEHIASYIYGDVTVIPATTVYYEETFITFNNATASGSGDVAKWASVEATDAVNELLNLDGNYGYASEYGNYSTFSAGRAMKTTITAVQAAGYPEGYNPTAEFTFVGTGFEVFAATSGATGTIFVTVTGSDGSSKYMLVDTYYGYKYENGSWVANGTEDDIGQYQVPVIKKTGLAYDKYNVKIEPLYDERVDHANLGYSEFYIDGVRVYDPLGAELTSTAKDAYKADKEYAPEYVSLRDALAAKDGNKALYIDGKTLTGTTDAEVSEYKTYGANNEVQLAKQGAVAFQFKAAGTAPAKVSIGIKLASGSNGRVTVAGNGSKTHNIEINSATDMYYEITDVYTSNGTVVITNSSDDENVIISLTTLKYSYDSEPASASSLTLYSNSRTVKSANRMMRAVYNIEDETFTTGDINGDDKINAVDLLILKKYLAGNADLGETGVKAADIDGDGKIDSRDLLALRAMM